MADHASPRTTKPYDRTVDEITLVIQVNGKVRGRIYVAFGTAREALEKHAMADTKVRSFLDGKQVVKVIVVPDKLVNIVVK